MQHALAPITALLIGVALLVTGTGLQGPLLVVRGEFESFSTLSIALVGSFYYVGFAAGCLLGPRLVRRVGHIRVFAAMAAIASAVPLLHGLVPLPLPWWGMRVATGFSFAVRYIVIESWLNERATNETRGFVLAVYQAINLTVLIAGQMLLPLADPGGFQLFAVTSVLISLAAVPVALSAAPAPAPIQSTEVRLRRLYRLSPVGFVGCLGVGLANGAWWSLVPIFASDAQLHTSGIAILMSAVIGGAAAQWPVGRLSDRMDRRRVLVGVCAAQRHWEPSSFCSRRIWARCCSRSRRFGARRPFLCIRSPSRMPTITRHRRISSRSPARSCWCSQPARWSVQSWLLPRCRCSRPAGCTCSRARFT
jgi:MFS family permease